MFWKKKSKTNSITCEELMKEFKVLHNANGNDEYKDIRDTYDRIKEFYKKKINNKEIDVSAERLRLEKKLGKYESNMLQSNYALAYTMIAGMIVLLFQVLTELFSDKFKVYENIVFLIIMIIYIIMNFGKSNQEQKPKDIAIYISLKVLDDIEKEKQQQDIKDKEEVEKKDKHERIQQYLSDKDKINMRTINNTLDIIAGVTKVIASHRKSK